MSKRSIIPILFLFLVLASIHTASAVSYTSLGTKENMAIGATFTAGDYKAILSDYQMDWNGKITAAMFTITENNITSETILLNLGEIEQFAEGEYKIKFTTNKNKIKCTLYKAIHPDFSVTSTTIQYDNYNRTEIQIKLSNAEAQNVKVSMDTTKIDVISKSATLKRESLTKDTTLTNLTVKWTGTGNITVKINYKDTDNIKHSKEFPVLETTKIINKKSSVVTVSNARITAEKTVFKNAAIRAIKYGNLSTESVKNLKAVTGIGSVTVVKVPKYRENFEKIRLAAAIIRVQKYIEYSEQNKDRLNAITAEIT